MAKIQFPIRLIEAYDIAPKVRHFVFERTDNIPFEFIPGQFINCHFEVNQTPIQRSYSIATRVEPLSAPNTRIELALSYVTEGKASEFLFDIKPGDTIHASGPFGRLILRDEDTPARYILVATGTGVTPYRSMLPTLMAKLAQDDVSVELILGAREPADLLYATEFIDCATANTGFKFYGCLSRTAPEVTHEYHRAGYVQDMFPELNLNPERDLVYLCGNPNMVDAAMNALKTLEFETHQIRREKYVFSH